ncbi:MULTISPECIES: DUF1818 family protein [Prochlorococcus]|uniref:DUF1818 family protein n=1 Tax=Prochlorococcus TaxID=1218 RepID=UPI0005339998|nr:MULTISPECIES: DUF1818 family protein [Prochlorococcus]KGG13455.1 hypothetical protein EV05_0109 [Prochlorococcus sp. MIT 0601]
MIRREGFGWRLAWDTSREIYSFLIAGENWAFELSQEEWDSLQSIITDLLDQFKALEIQLMAEEFISLELERCHWWVCLNGTKEAWSLKFILQQDHPTFRSLEGGWPNPIAEVVTSAMRKMWDSQ